MPSPYRGEDVAGALVEGARRAGVPMHRLEVLSDEAAQIWTVRATLGGGEDRRMIFPFASARGIYTPAEIAALFISGSWPFG